MFGFRIRQKKYTLFPEGANDYKRNLESPRNTTQVTSSDLRHKKLEDALVLRNADVFQQITIQLPQELISVSLVYIS